jgi:hypothetical protein
MKVIQAGSLVWSNNMAHVSGWIVSSSLFPDGPVPKAAAKALLKTALLHIAKQHQIDLVEPVEVESTQVPLDVERAAADVIAMARWVEAPDSPKESDR